MIYMLYILQGGNLEGYFRVKKGEIIISYLGRVIQFLE